MSERWLVVGLALLLLAAALVTWVAPPSTGAQVERTTGSTWATHTGGASQLYGIVRGGGEVERLQGRLDDLPTAGSLVVLAPWRTLTAAEQEALARAVPQGLTVFYASTEPLDALTERGLTWAPRTLGARPAARAPSLLTRGLRTLEGEGPAELVLGPGWVPLVASGDRAQLALRHEGAGRWLVLADPSVLTNRGQQRADHRVLAADLSRWLPRPVAFAEGVHGVDPARGALAWMVREGLGPLLLQGLAWLLLLAWYLRDRQPLPVVTERAEGGWGELAQQLARRWRDVDATDQRERWSPGVRAGRSRRG